MMSSGDITFRRATSADVPGMAQCRLTDPAAGSADPRMADYFDGEHHPQQALLPRTGYVALCGENVVAYIAGHQTRRHGCEGELQYLFVAPAYRRRGIGTALLRLLAAWFREQGVKKVCVGVADDSPPQAKPFVEHHGAAPLKNQWHAWREIGTLAPRERFRKRHSAKPLASG
jgi:GNAT superfamily N-acetyltransferase